MACANNGKLQSHLIRDLDTHDNDPLLNLCTVAKALGVHASTVRNWVATGILKACRKPNGLYKIRKSDLERLLAACPIGDDENIVEKVDSLKSED